MTMYLYFVAVLAVAWTITFVTTCPATFAYYQGNYPNVAKDEVHKDWAFSLKAGCAYASIPLWGIWECYLRTDKFKYGFSTKWAAK